MRCWFKRNRSGTETFTFSRQMTPEELKEVSAAMDSAFAKMDEAFAQMSKAFAKVKP